MNLFMIYMASSERIPYLVVFEKNTRGWNLIPDGIPQRFFLFILGWFGNCVSMCVYI